ncbi:Efflux pump ustT, partial [Lachnellula suecica]
VTMFVGYFRDRLAIEWFWAGNFFLLLGGGSPVALQMFFTILADVVSEEQRAFVFFQATAAGLIATVAGVPLAAWLLAYSVWLPMWIGFGFIACGAALMFALPETLDLQRPDHALSGERERLLQPENEVNDDDEVQKPLHRSFSSKSLGHVLKRMEESSFVFKSPLLCVLAFTFLGQRLSKDPLTLLFQLASKRFGWSLKVASLLIPLTAIVNFVLLVVILPAIYAVLTRKTSLAPTARDLVVARGSVVFSIMGSFGIAFSDLPWLMIISTIIFSLGAGFSGAVRSLLTSLVEPSQISRLYGVLAIVETIGALVAARR